MLLLIKSDTNMKVYLHWNNLSLMWAEVCDTCKCPGPCNHIYFITTDRGAAKASWTRIVLSQSTIECRLHFRPFRNCKTGSRAGEKWTHTHTHTHTAIWWSELWFASSNKYGQKLCVKLLLKSRRERRKLKIAWFLQQHPNRFWGNIDSASQKRGEIICEHNQKAKLKNMKLAAICATRFSFHCTLGQTTSKQRQSETRDKTNSTLGLPFRSVPLYPSHWQESVIKLRNYKIIQNVPSVQAFLNSVMQVRMSAGQETRTACWW